jgi:hypothetical protein
MQATKVLHKLLDAAASEMHACRREALAAAVDSVLHERCVTVTGIGRGMRSQAREKHCIKRADRLLSNRHLHAEAPGVYALMCQWLVGGQKHPVILDLTRFGGQV